jgi:hypothetical protein
MGSEDLKVVNAAEEEEEEIEDEEEEEEEEEEEAPAALSEGATMTHFSVPPNAVATQTAPSVAEAANTPEVTAWSRPMWCT